VWPLADDPTIEDELHLVGTTDIEVLPDDLLEEHATGHWLVEDLGQRELGLKDRQLVSNVPRTVLRREGMRQSAEPFPEQRIDVGR
jgi:hypothetical protein